MSAFFPLRALSRQGSFGTQLYRAGLLEHQPHAVAVEADDHGAIRSAHHAVGLFHDDLHRRVDANVIHRRFDVQAVGIHDFYATTYGAGTQLHGGRDIGRHTRTQSMLHHYYSLLQAHCALTTKGWTTATLSNHVSQIFNAVRFNRHCTAITCPSRCGCRTSRSSNRPTSRSWSFRRNCRCESSWTRSRCRDPDCGCRRCCCASSCGWWCCRCWCYRTIRLKKIRTCPGPSPWCRPRQYPRYPNRWLRPCRCPTSTRLERRGRYLPVQPREVISFS